MEKTTTTTTTSDHNHHQMACHGGDGGDAGEEVSSGIRTAETMLRLAPVGLCVAALVVMLKDSEINEFGSISYSNLSAFRYLVHANGICAGYSLLSAVIAAMHPSSSSSASSTSRLWTFFSLDQILTYVVLAAGAVSAQVLYLAYDGDPSLTWSDACSAYGGFCKRATASVVITFLVVCFYVFLSLISSYNLFTRYDSPAIDDDSNDKNLELAVSRS